MADHSTRPTMRVNPRHSGDSDPDMDEALRRAREGRLAVSQ